MLKRARALMRLMGDEDLFNQAGVDFILEAWAAARFARARGALAVRLVSTRDQFPDFQVQTRARAIESWEFTEVNRDRRRRGQEYREKARRRVAGNHRIRSVPIERLRKQADHVPSWIRKRCRAKVEKHYAGRAGLLVYLNWGDFGFWHQEIEESLLTATEVAKESFAEIWVLWKARLYRKWRNGVSAELVRDAPWRSSEL